MPMELTLAHSGDPDDAFMWWPLTGKVMPDGTPRAGSDAKPRIEDGAFSFRAVPGDIAVFNRLAARPLAAGGAPYDITALSARAWTDVADRYAITDCGGSFGDGYGPKVVTRSNNATISCINCLRNPYALIAVPGLKTTAAMTLLLALGGESEEHSKRFVEVAFDQILPAVMKGEVEAGLVIHEGQLSFRELPLKQVVDLGAWWKQETGLPLPLGVNAIKRDLDERAGPGSVRRVARLLEMSLDYALSHRDESVDYTMAYADLNAKNSGTPAPSKASVEQYLDMYVTELTVQMGQRGRTALEWLLREGAEHGLCAAVHEIEPVCG
jgi:1,4-dihydroxy-6-naphthoate synthase